MERFESDLNESFYIYEAKNKTKTILNNRRGEKIKNLNNKKNISKKSKKH